MKPAFAIPQFYPIFSNYRKTLNYSSASDVCTLKVFGVTSISSAFPYITYETPQHLCFLATIWQLVLTPTGSMAIPSCCSKLIKCIKIFAPTLYPLVPSSFSFQNATSLTFNLLNSPYFSLSFNPCVSFSFALNSDSGERYCATFLLAVFAYKKYFVSNDLIAPTTRENNLFFFSFSFFKFFF